METIIQALVEILYFNKAVDKVKIDLKKNCNQEIEFACRGRGNLTGKITRDTTEIWVSGTEEEVKAWTRFFNDFATVPEFNLREYIQWAKGTST